MKWVLWSGGADSTLVLYEALQKSWVWQSERSDKTVKTDPQVCAFSIVHSSIDCQREQSRARARIRRELTRRGYSCDYHEIRVEDPFTPWTTQRAIWLALVLPYIGDNELAIGWIKGECDTVPLAEEIVERFNRFKQHKGKLLVPLRYTEKVAVVHRLREAKLYDLCWSCELDGLGERALTDRRAGRADPKVVAEYPSSRRRKLLEKRCGRCAKCVELEIAEDFLKKYPSHALQSLGVL